MASLWRATMFFKMQSEGWSETYFYSNTAATEPTVRADAILLAGARLQLLNVSAILIGIRVSDDLVFRDSDLLGSPDFPAIGTSPFTSALPARTCLIVRLQSSLNHRRTLKLSGLPSNIDSAGVWRANGPTWSPSWALFVSRLQSIWAIKVNTAILDTQKSKIQSIDNAGLMTVTNPENFPLGAFVGRLSGVKGVLPNPNGRTFKMIKGGAGTIVIAGWPPRPAATIFTGTCRQVIYATEGLVGAVQLRMGERKTGRPFDSPRGRRSVAR